MSKEYPGQLTVEKFKLRKSENELFVELLPELSKSEVAKFLDEQKGLIEWKFKATEGKALTLSNFNKYSLHRKWVTRAKGATESIDALIGKIEIDERVHVAGPVYFRVDLSYPNGFTFNDQIIIRFDEKTEKSDLEVLFQEMGVEIVKGPRGDLGKGMMLLCVLDKKKQNTLEVAQRLNESNIIESGGVNWRQLHSALCVAPNDTYYPEQWNLHNTGNQEMPDSTRGDPRYGTNGCDINVENAWDISKGSPLVVIAIIDSGCDLGHPDLKEKYVQPDRWLNRIEGGPPNDDFGGHGTCCAGIAAAHTNYLASEGVAGVGWHCRIMPIRVSSFFAGLLESDLNAALDHALKNQADIINMSLAWELTTANIDVKLEACYNADMVIVASAGNNALGKPNEIAYPASNKHVIAVGATNENDRRCKLVDWTAPFRNPNVTGSQYGPELSVVAPGVHIRTTDVRGLSDGGNDFIDTLVWGNARQGIGDAAGNYYWDFGGTSAAAPHVAGLAGLMLALNPSLKPDQIRTIIEDTAEDQVGDPAEDVAGPDPYMGHGRINAHEALKKVTPIGPADVYIRDTTQDIGAEPHDTSPLCYSPDIIVRQTTEPNPEIAFSDMTQDPGSDKVAIGQDNYIYIRVHNKLASIKSDIHVRVYFAPLTTTCTPDQWTYLGQMDFYDVDPDSSKVSEEPLVWENVPDPGSVGHYCIIASIEGVNDPHPDPVGITNATEYMDFIRGHNNICYRNVVFEHVLSNTSLSTNFFIGGFVGDETETALRIERNPLAIQANIGLDLPYSLLKGNKIELKNVVMNQKEDLKGFRSFELEKENWSEIKGLIAAGSKNLAKLKIRIPEDAKPDEVYQIMVQQLVKGRVLGDFQVIAKVVNPEEAK